MNVEMSLLDYLAQRTACLFLSDLRHLDKKGQNLLLQVLESLPAEAVSLKDWNDALSYLTGASPEETAGEARARLLMLLRALR